MPPMFTVVKSLEDKMKLSCFNKESGDTIDPIANSWRENSHSSENTREEESVTRTE